MQSAEDLTEPFCAAAALLHGGVGPQSFSPAALQDSRISTLMHRIELYCDPAIDAAYPDRLGARVEIPCRENHRRFETPVWSAHGTPEDPCTDAELTDKFRDLCKYVLDEAAANRLLAAVRALNKIGTMEELSAAVVSQFVV